MSRWIALIHGRQRTRLVRRSLAITLFAPWIAVIVVAPALPVARRVARDEADPRQVLGALPEVEIRDERPHGGAVRKAQWLPLELERDEDTRGESLRHRHVRGVPMR